MSAVEGYHEPLRRAYRIVRKEETPMNPDSGLQAVMTAVNCSVGPDGLVSTVLVHGALPLLRLPTDAPAASTFDRARTAGKAKKSLSRYFTQRQVHDALRSAMVSM